MEKQKLTKDKIASILNKYSFLGHSEWRFNYDDKVFSVYYADGYLDIDIARAIAKVYLRLEAKKKAGANSINRVKLEGIDQGEKVLVLDFDDNKCLTPKETAEGFISTVKAVSNISENVSIIDTVNSESTKQKTDLEFLKESIEIVEVADGIRESIVDAMLDSKKEEIMKEIAQSNKAGEGIQYYTITKCTALQHIVHSGYPLIPEMLTCMLSPNHTSQHCATDKNGNRVNWS